MNSITENRQVNDADEIVLLGVASVETQGPGAAGEPNGGELFQGMSEE